MPPAQATFDPNASYQPASNGAPAFDPNASYQPATASAQSTQPASALSRFKENLLSGFGIGSDEDAKNFFEHPINTLMNSFKGQGELEQKALDAYKRGDYKGAVIHGLNYLVPFMGQQTDKAGEQLQQGDYAGGIGRTLGVGAGVAAADATTGALTPKTPAPEGFTPTPTPKPTPKAVVTAPVRYAARSAESLVNQKLVPAKPLLRIMTPADEAEALHIKVPGRDYGLPSRETPEATPPASAQPTEPTPATATPPATPAPNFPKPDTSPKAIEDLLNQATGGKPLQPGVSLRNQASAAAPNTSLPEGFTPVKSSALKGYKYDPEAQTFTSITNNGQSYTHSGVTPDMMAAFENANSKGTAWNILRKSPGVDLVEKNGKPVVKSTYRSASPEDVAPGEEVPASSQAASQPAASPKAASAPGEDDLTSLLQQSLENANLKKNGYVQTTADPGELSKRWGVDAESLASGREQTRGMSPEETEQYVQKLSDRYKQGFPVEPVMETRDANNNIIEVDGRARAIAAQRAGVKRIPIIVRRMPATTTVQ